MKIVDNILIKEFDEILYWSIWSNYLNFIYSQLFSTMLWNSYDLSEWLNIVWIYIYFNIKYIFFQIIILHYNFCYQ